jgi:DNA-binding beta-propeller fold protein YncE
MKPVPPKPLAAKLIAASLGLAILGPAPASAEILAAMNYESKPGVTPRREGIAIVDIDPASANFNRIVRDAPLPPDFVAHHIYFNRDQTKAYVTSLGHSEIAVYDANRLPEGAKFVPAPDCKVGEDMVFTRDRKRWFLSCMGSSNIIVGDAQTDQTIGVIFAPEPPPGAEPKPFIKHPHGLTLNEDLDLLIATSTVDPADFSKAGDTVTLIQASTGKLLATQRVSNKPAPAAEAPVETAFVPKRAPQIAFITNMSGSALWRAAWRDADRSFSLTQAFDFASIGQGAPLEMEFSDSGDRLYVTTAKPGALNIFDLGNAAEPKLVASVPAAAGAHHFVFSPDDRYAFVQNSLLNLPGMSDGSVTVIDLEAKKPVATIDVLQKAGLNPNCIILLPKWRREAD